MNNIKKYACALIAILISFNPTIILANNYHSPYKYSVPQLPSPSDYNEPFIAENGSYRGQYSERTYKPKNDYVRSYQRKDGTHVRGHYRSRKR